MDAFSPPVSNYVDSGSPSIAEYTKQNDAGDTMAITGESMGSFLAYGVGVTNNQTVAFSEGRQAAVTLSGSLPSDEMYLVWPTNSNGYGTPVAVNKTETWWIGPDTVATGETFSVYGRNLSLGAGDTYLWIEESDTWITNSAGNPYRADFTVPALSTGSYTVWAHNGKGRKYGWGESLTLTVQSIDGWNDNTNTWLNVGDYADLNAAIDAADATPWSTVYIPAGTNSLTASLSVNSLSQVRVAGAGIDATTIMPGGSYANSNIVWASNLDTVVFEDLGFIATSHIDTLLLFNSSDNLVFNNVRFDNSEATTYYVPANHTTDDDCPFFFLSSTNIVLDGCAVIQRTESIFKYCEQVFVSDTSFKGRNEAATLCMFWDGREASVENCTFGNFNDSDLGTANSRAMGRGLYGKNPWQKFYAGNCETINLCTHTNAADANVGEHFMFETTVSYDRKTVSSATSNTVTFSSAPTSDDTHVIVIQSGTGQGQSRYISNVSGSVVTVDENWAVTPDNTSVALMGRYAKEIALYNNSFDGRPEALNGPYEGDDQRPAVTGIMAYGGCVDLVADGNKFHEMRFAINPQSRSDVTYIQTPNFFNQYLNNSITNCYRGIAPWVDKPTAMSTFYSPVLLGNVFRDTYMTNMTESPIYYRGDYVGSNTGEFIDFQVIEGSVFVDFGGEPIDYHNIPEASVTNQVYAGNTTNGAAWSP